VTGFKCRQTETPSPATESKADEGLLECKLTCVKIQGQIKASCDKMQQQIKGLVEYKLVAWFIGRNNIIFIHF
jgi:hypothetical protein